MEMAMGTEMDTVVMEVVEVRKRVDEMETDITVVEAVVDTTLIQAVVLLQVPLTVPKSTTTTTIYK
jgi:hypothetical protein